MTLRASQARYRAFTAGWISAGGWHGHQTLTDVWTTHSEQVLTSSGPAMAYAIGQAAAIQARYHTSRQS